jgi:hypothetical protein
VSYRQIIKTMLAKRDELLLSNAEWARRTKDVCPHGRGVSYQTIRRMELGATPRMENIVLLEETLKQVPSLRKRGVRVVA